MRQARVAEAERRRAEARFQDVRRLANSLIYELHDAIANLPGATAARQVLVARALEYLDQLAAESRGDLALQRELANAYKRFGDVQGGGLGANLGDSQGALATYGKALAIRRALAAREPPAVEDVLGLALLEFDLGALHRARGENQAAERSYRASAARLEGLRARKQLPEAQDRRIGSVYQRLADVQSVQGKRGDALQSAQRAISEAEAAWRARPDDAAARSTLAASSHQLADALAAEQRFAEALERSRQARRLLESALQENPLDAQHQRVLLLVLNGEGRHLLSLGDAAGAVEVYTGALEVAEDALARDPRDRWSQLGVAVVATSLGDALRGQGEGVRAAGQYRRAIRITGRALAEDPGLGFARMQMASAEFGLGRVLLAGKPPASSEGCQTLRRVRTYWKGLQEKGELPAEDAAELVRLETFLARCPTS
jgi:non-specific serine/threonine protein kinase/serine/threonine-protein kinase